MPKNAEIIAIGTELLTPLRMDTNSLLVTEHLNLLGVEVVTKQIIGDDQARLTDAIRVAVGRSDIVILMGGLGPTEDDITREAAAAALGLKLVLSLEQESILITRFRQINRPMAKNNLRQAYLLEGAEAMANPHGSAPGQFLSTDHGALALLPGPPRELKPMVENELAPRLKPVLPPAVIKRAKFPNHGDRRIGSGHADRAGVHEIHESGDDSTFFSRRLVRAPCARERRRIKKRTTCFGKWATRSRSCWATAFTATIRTSRWKRL